MTDGEKEFYLLLIGGWLKSVTYSGAWLRMNSMDSYYSLDMAFQLARNEPIDLNEHYKFHNSLVRKPGDR